MLRSFIIYAITFSLTFIFSFNESKASDSMLEFLQQHAVSLSQFEDFHPFLSAATDKQLVLLGEASHGTSEYYTWRADISKYLITEKGYNFIAIEADWPSAFVVNRYVKDLRGAAGSAEEALEGFVRWPHWMWKNEEVLELVNWLREYNSHLPLEERIGFYGVDLQNKQKSMDVILRKLEQYDSDLHQSAQNSYQCLLRFDDRVDYLRMVANTNQTCVEDVESVYELVASNLELFGDQYEQFNMYHNAVLVVEAEKNLRANLSRGSESWNVRAQFFQYTADELLLKYGGDDRNARGMVWAHNTHIGDADATDMGRAGMVNIGSLARKAYGKDNVLTIGFGTATGELLAGREWGAQQETMTLPEPPQGTWEYIAGQLDYEVFGISFEEIPAELSNERLGNRAVGVTYSPENDAQNFVPSVMSQRYDVFIFFKETGTLHPLGF